MSCLFRASTPLICLALASVFPGALHAQNPYAAQGGEYAIAGSNPGDQTHPHVSLNSSGGYIVWQDNFTDGDGLGISARRLDSSLSGVLSSFRVNEQGAGDQENPRATMLSNGGAAFIWQGGRQGFQNIYGRFLSSENTWVSGDIRINSHTNSHKLNPDIVALPGGQVVAVWSSWDQDGSMQGIYGQLLSATGQKLGEEFRVNQHIEFNQRTPAIAALNSGGFVVVWVSEQQRLRNTDEAIGSVDIYARLYNSKGNPAGGEFLVNTGTSVCANPSVAASPNGGFVVAWGEKDTVEPMNSWDIWARAFNNQGEALGSSARRINAFVYGDQYGPRISALGSDYLAVWTSLGQDGSWEGVYGHFLSSDGQRSGSEFRVNTTTLMGQKLPAVASDRAGRFLVAWTSFGGGVNSFDLQAQRYAPLHDPLPAPNAPFVSVLSANALSLAWPSIAGFDLAHYELFINGADTPGVITTNNWHTLTDLAPSSTHTFRLVYVLAGNRRSPLSTPAGGTTYDRWNWGGIPFEWMEEFFGTDTSKWPAADSDYDGDGMTVRQEFLAGTDPTDEKSTLRTWLSSSSDQGLFLMWNTVPGFIYQVQTSDDLKQWGNLESRRFAYGRVDSIWVGGEPAAYYRVIRVR